MDLNLVDNSSPNVRNSSIIQVVVKNVGMSIVYHLTAQIAFRAALIPTILIKLHHRDVNPVYLTAIYALTLLTVRNVYLVFI